MRITRVLNQQHHLNMNFESNDPNGSSFSSKGHGAHTCRSHRLQCGHSQCETCPDETHRNGVTDAAPNAAQAPSASRCAPRPLRADGTRRRATAATQPDRQASISPWLHAVPRVASAKPDQSLSRPTLRDIVNTAYTTAEMASAAHQAIKCAVSSFELFGGYMPAQEITMETASSFVEQLVACRLSRQSIRLHLQTLSSVVARGKKVGLLPSDLLCAFKLCGKDMTKRTLRNTLPQASHVSGRSGRGGDLQDFFTSGLYRAGPPEPTNEMAGRYWAPLVSLYTGATARELEQMKVSDVEQFAGAWALRVRAVPGDEENKEAPDERLIPVHPELVSCGFMSYTAQRKLAGQVSLFPLGPCSATDGFGTTSRGPLRKV